MTRYSRIPKLTRIILFMMSWIVVLTSSTSFPASVECEKFSMLLVKAYQVHIYRVITIPYNSATLSRALAEPRLSRRNVLL